MEKKVQAILFAFAILAVTIPITMPLGAQAKDSNKPRVAVFGFLNRTGNSGFDVPAESAGDALYLGMKMLGAYDVSLPKTKPDTSDTDSIGSWCDENGVDYVLFGEVSTEGSGQKYTLASFDNGKKKITVSKTATGESVMDVFEASDNLILSVLDVLTGRHIGFGKIRFRNTGAEGSFIAYVDGVELEANPGMVGHIVSGNHLVTVVQIKRKEKVQIASEPISVPEGKTATFSFALQEIPKAPKGELDAYKELIAVPMFGAIDYWQITGGKTGFRHHLSAFALGKYEVTFELWNEVIQWAESDDRGEKGFQFGPVGKRGSDGLGVLPEKEIAHQPVTGVSWADAIVWCNAYSEMDGLEPVYYANKECTVPIRSYADLQDGDAVISANKPFVKKDSKGYRLPTSGEWQYAASCANTYGFDGSATIYDGKNGLKTVDENGTVHNAEDIAWYERNSDFRTHPVGMKAPNAWNFFDICGNVWELTFDWDGPDPKKEQTNYAGPPRGTERVIRGGGFSSTLETLLGRKSTMLQSYADIYTGFRVCKSE